MLYTKFRRNRPTGFGEDFLKAFTIYGHGSHLGHVTSIILIKFSFHCTQNGPVVSEKNKF